MINKTIIQIILSVLIILSLLVFYNTYFTNDKKPSLQTEKLDEKKIKKNDKQNLKSNLIYNLDYKSTDIDNNQYFINSESGIMSESGSEFLMNKVNARIILNDLSVIIISSDKALYNNVNYNTKFYGNVVAKYEEQTIFSQNINLDFEERRAIIYQDVVFQNLKTKLKTDKIEFDLVTKNILMSMNNKNNKINLKSKF